MKPKSLFDFPLHRRLPRSADPVGLSWDHAALPANHPLKDRESSLAAFARPPQAVSVAGNGMPDGAELLILLRQRPQADLEH
jgi:hypothetical protein